MFDLLCFVLLLFTFSGCLARSKSQCEFDWVINREIENDGFHRLLVVNVDVDAAFTSKVNNSCDLAVYQVLPSGVFIDSEQLNELSNFKKPSNLYYVNETVNVEASESSSSSINVYILYNNDNDSVLRRQQPEPAVVRYTFALPIHARYHSPQHGGQYRSIVIPNASLLIRCQPYNDLSVGNEILKDFLQRNCVEHYNRSLPCGVKCYSDSKETALCDNWYTIVNNVQLSTIVRHNGELLLTVPVGDLNHLYLVQLVTLIITNLCALYILYHLFHYNH